MLIATSFPAEIYYKPRLEYNVEIIPQNIQAGNPKTAWYSFHPMGIFEEHEPYNYQIYFAITNYLTIVIKYTMNKNKSLVIDFCPFNQHTFKH